MVLLYREKKLKICKFLIWYSKKLKNLMLQKIKLTNSSNTLKILYDQNYDCDLSLVIINVYTMGNCK